MSEIFADVIFANFARKVGFAKFSFTKIIAGMYKMAAVYTLVVRARAIAFVYACSKGIFSVSGLLTAAKNLSNAKGPNSLINVTSSNTALILKP